MKIWHVSDTHGIHEKLIIPPGIDAVFHTGDSCNKMDPNSNFIEFQNFLNWFSKLPIKHKVYVPGNHDTCLQSLVSPQYVQNLGVNLLVNDSIVINGLKIWGSPYMPRWGKWPFMVNRGNLYDQVWKHMPEDIDILLTHTPPYGYLDLTYHVGSQGWENVGCQELARRAQEVKPKLHCFGHIHSFKESAIKHSRVIDNNGIRVAPNWPSVLSHACTNLHGSFGKVWHNGNIIDWDFVTSMK